ncbi:MAG TPA: DUF58 domain-containing protein, partial [Thiolinea sp.]|nr:DUF58 domain-containing protein [Thiolinea sp.]
MILPARRSFYLIAANLALAVVVSFFPAWISLWYLVLGASLSLWVLDGLLALAKHGLEIERQLPASLPVGIRRTIRLRIRHTSSRPLTVMIYDHYPEQVQAQGLPLRFSLPVGEYAEPAYSMLPLERGKHIFPKVQIRILSPLKLWWHDLNINT